MNDKPLKIDISIWKKLSQVAALSDARPWTELAQEMGTTSEEARHLTMAWQEALQELQSHTGENEEVFQAWNLVHWCQLTQLLEDITSKVEFHDLRPLAIPLLKQQRQHPAYPVYIQLRQRWQELAQKPKANVEDKDDETDHTIHLIEEALFRRETLNIECHDDKTYTVIPCRIIFLEGNLSLIAEGTHDHSLFSIDLSEVKNIQRAEKIKAPRAGIHEISEFVRALRSMSENETRLVLKIKNPELFELMPQYQFLGKPCLVTNSSGDLIWAAWVEPCDSLFDWLSKMDGQVEILEPSEFILDYAVYCEEKLRKLA